MANDDLGFDPAEWDDVPRDLWDALTDGQGWDDQYGQFLFDLVFVDPQTGDVRDAAYEALQEWFDQNYDLVFDDVFDWDAWREWYGGE